MVRDLGEAPGLAEPATHTLTFLEPGHFHAALTLGERPPRVSDEISVYAQPGPELDDFLEVGPDPAIQISSVHHPGGGDRHRSRIRGTRSELLVEQDATTGFRRRLAIIARRETERVGTALAHAVDAWQDERSGLAVTPSPDGWELRVPRALDPGHERHFPLVLVEFLARVEKGVSPSALEARTLEKYRLLAQASVEARRTETAPPVRGEGTFSLDER